MEENQKMRLGRNFNLLFKKPEEEAYKIDEKVKEMMGEGVYIDDLKQYLVDNYGSEFFDYSYLDGLLYMLTDKKCKYPKDVVYSAINAETIEETAIAGKFQIIANTENPYDTESARSFTIKSKENGEQVLQFSTVEKFLEGYLEGKTPSEELEKYEEEISTEECRSSRCHEFAIYASRLLSKELGIQGKIVTGYTHYYVPQYNCLHSWIETETEDGPVVIDSTMNAVMDKEGYYKLKHIDEKSIISEISTEDLLSDMEKYEEVIEKIDKVDYKTYLTMRDEIVKSLERNKHLFKKDSDSKGESATGRRPENDGEER